MWKRNLHALHAAALPEIEMIERAGAHADQSFARAGDRIGGVFVAEDIGSSMGVKPNGLHQIPKPRESLQSCKARDLQPAREVRRRESEDRSSAPGAGQDPDRAVSRESYPNPRRSRCSFWRDRGICRAAALTSSAVTCARRGTNSSKYVSGQAVQRELCDRTCNLSRRFEAARIALAQRRKRLRHFVRRRRARVGDGANLGAGLAESPDAVTSVPTLVCITNGPMPRRRLNPVRTP